MQPLIECNHVGFSISQDRVIIPDLSLSIYPGDFVVVLGGNGSGKSTLLKLFNKTYHHTSGNIYFNNKTIDGIVTITQSMSDSLFMEMSVEENAALIECAHLEAAGKSFRKKDLLLELPTYLSQFNPNLAISLKKPIKNLSGGEQQILAFALYLRRQPDLLLLDEHTSALDPKKSDQVMQLTQSFIEKRKLTCLMTTHQLDYALKYGNRLIAIREGKIVFDANAKEKQLLTMGDLLQYCY